MKVLIIGASGLIGGKILDRFSPRYATLGTYFSNSKKLKSHKNLVHLDVTKHKVVEKFIIDFLPDVVIYRASVTQPELCEANPQWANEVNYEGLVNVASVCATLGKKIVYISSDYVFDGSKPGAYFEDDEQDPLNILGVVCTRSEKYLRGAIPNHLIIRSSMIYGFSQNTDGRGIVNSVLESVLAGRETFLDNVYKRYPVLADDVAEVVERLIRSDEVGTFHASQDFGVTKYEFARMVTQEFGFSDHLLRIRNEDEMSLLAKRPSHVLLSNEKVLSVLPDFRFTSPQEGVGVFRRQFGCAFRLIYSVRPDMLVANQNASEFRISAGRQVIKESPLPADVDCIVPIPESGLYSATGVAAESKLPLFFGIIRDYFTEKTLYSATQETRHQKLRRKLIPVESVVRGKKICLVDEAILSGATLRVVINSLKEAGVSEIHVRIPSPIMMSKCTARVLPETQLIYRVLGVDGMRVYEATLAKELGVQSIGFITLEGFKALFPSPGSFCVECFETGKRLS